MSRKGIYKYLSDLISNLVKFVFNGFQNLNV